MLPVDMVLAALTERGPLTIEDFAPEMLPLFRRPQDVEASGHEHVVEVGVRERRHYPATGAPEAHPDAGLIRH